MLSTRAGFAVRPVYKIKRQTPVHFARQKLSFVIAVLSILAFVVGNMVGQHGWYAFWKSVLGKDEQALFAVFPGTVPPIIKLPDYTEWAKYGGNKQLHTFKEAPQNVLRDLPLYDQAELIRGGDTFANRVYSTLWAGAYNGPQGSHAGVDIDAPKGTPVVAITHGIIERARMDKVGFGHHVMIRHPNVPDPENPGKTTTLYSIYAHLDLVSVNVGEVVRKGQQLGTVGNTGLVFGATGFHLYFQVSKESAPFQPYWPFTSGEAQTAGLSFFQAVNSIAFQDRVFLYTLNPMQFVQQYLNRSEIVVSKPVNEVAAATPRLTSKQLAAKRRADRMQTRGVAQVSPMTSVATSNPTPAPVTETPITDSESSNTIIVGTNTDVHHLEIVTSGKLTRSWQKVQIRAVDQHGDLVRSPSFQRLLYLTTILGDAQIRPSELSPLDFVGGVATVNLLPQGQRTIVIGARGAFTADSGPMVYDR